MICKNCGHEIEPDKVLGEWIHKKVRSNGKCGMFLLMANDILAPTHYCDCDNPEAWDSFCGLVFDTVAERNEHERGCMYCRQYFIDGEKVEKLIEKEGD